VGGDGAAGRYRLSTILLHELRAYVGVQREVQRANLLPQPIELGAELVGSHVVVGTPESARVSEAHLAGALVCQLDEPRVLLAHGRSESVPAYPEIEQDCGVLGSGHGLFHFALPEAPPGVWAALETIPAFAVGSLK